MSAKAAKISATFNREETPQQPHLKLKGIFMRPYLNLSGQSNVVFYEITDDAIQVVFRSGAQRNYLYNSVRPGKAVVDHMKQLAQQGRGLNTYISRIVKSNFAQKW